MANVSDYLNQIFLKANAECYWHYVMKNNHSRDSFTKEKVDKQVALLQSKTNQANSFEKKLDKGWTPLHVAAIAGNKEGMIFLRTMGVSTTIQDEYGKCPQDYCLALQRPDLLSILKASQLELCLKPLFSKWAVGLSQAPFHYRGNTHDFGVQIQELLFACPTANLQIPPNQEREKIKVDHFAKNISQVGDIEGFNVRFSTKQHFVRDSFIPLGDGTHALPNFSTDTIRSLECCDSLALVTQSKAIYRSNHFYLYGAMGITQQFSSISLREYQELFPGDGYQLPYYLEGGNYYLASNAQGKKKLLMGMDLLYCTLNQFRRENYFHRFPRQMAGLSKRVESRVTNADYPNILTEMHAQGLLNDVPGVGSGLIKKIEESILVLNVFKANKFSHLDHPTKNPYYSLAVSTGRYQPLNLTADVIHKTKDRMIEYLTQKEFTKFILAESFKMNLSEFHLIAQLLYHLDTFMRPGPKGSFFVQSFEMCLDILKMIAEIKDVLKLTSKDCEMLSRYAKTSEELAKQLKPLLDSVSQVLGNAGFVVIPTPALFFDASPSFEQLNKDTLDVVSYNVNFLNAISGWSEKTKRFYYIVTGAQLGDTLGQLLMQMYRHFLESYVQDIHVHYVGYNPDQPDDFSEGMGFSSRWGTLAGVHCLSCELKTASHVG